MFICTVFCYGKNSASSDIQKMSSACLEQLIISTNVSPWPRLQSLYRYLGIGPIFTRTSDT